MSALNKFMSRGFVPPQVHGVLDYPLAAILIAGPLVLDFDYKAATIIALVFGGGAAVLAVATAWSTGIVKIIPPLLHGYADTLVTLALIVLPFAVGFSYRTPALIFYVVVGGAGLLATLATRFESPVPSAHPMAFPNPTAAPARPHVVVVGGGFGGIEAVKRLARAPVDVTLVDRRNFHLFQPLTYQVATGVLSQGEVAFSLRALFHRAKNVRVMLAEVTGFDLEAREVRLDSAAGAHTPDTLGYDSLIVAGGSTYSYFGHDEWSGIAPEVKSLESALETRSRILNAFEKAELEPDPEARRAQLTFVVVGAGPTGVEMAGQIGELARDTLRHDFRAIDPRQARIVLVEAGERVLSTFPPSLSAKAERALAQLGVTTMLRTAVVGIDPDGVTLQREDNSEYLPARTVIWAAGVRASALAGELASAAGAEQDRAGRVTVESDLTLQGHPEVIALGDMVRVRGSDGEAQQLPGVAPAAIQQGRYAGRLMANRVRGRKTPPFHYRDKGNLATIGRARAVADLHFVRVNGPLAWLLWLGVHIFYLIGFQNRLLVLLRWGFSFITRGRGAQLITGAEAHRH